MEAVQIKWDCLVVIGNYKIRICAVKLKTIRQEHLKTKQIKINLLKIEITSPSTKRSTRDVIKLIFKTKIFFSTSD